MYEAAGITKHDILRQEKKKFYTNCPPEDTVYFEICFLLTEKVTNNENLRAMYIDLYSKRYPEIVEKADVSKRMFLERPDLELVEYSVENQTQIEKLQKKYTDREEVCIFNVFFDALIVYDDDVWSLKVVQDYFAKEIGYYEKFQKNAFNTKWLIFTHIALPIQKN